MKRKVEVSAKHKSGMTVVELRAFADAISDATIPLASNTKVRGQVSLGGNVKSLSIEWDDEVKMGGAL